MLFPREARSPATTLNSEVHKVQPPSIHYSIVLSIPHRPSFPNNISAHNPAQQVHPLKYSARDGAPKSKGNIPFASSIHRSFFEATIPHPFKEE